MKPYLLSSYRKAYQVIQSSLNQDHIESSRNYINNFFKLYSTPSIKSNELVEVRDADKMVAQMYGRLYRILNKKEKNLKKVV
tara:strand:+ start:499 stop:744 length:246 start_codon:yes stop_codon:yes gene_type:complete